MFLKQALVAPEQHGGEVEGQRIDAVFPAAKVQSLSNKALFPLVTFEPGIEVDQPACFCAFDQRAATPGEEDVGRVAAGFLDCQLRLVRIVSKVCMSILQ